MQLEFQAEDFFDRAVSPFHELGAYEALWSEQSASFKSIADMFAKREGSLPSDFVERSRAVSYANDVHAMLREAGIDQYGVRIHGAGDYPERLRVADHPIELLYFQGWWISSILRGRLPWLERANPPTKDWRERAGW